MFDGNEDGGVIIIHTNLSSHQCLKINKKSLGSISKEEEETHFLLAVFYREFIFPSQNNNLFIGNNSMDRIEMDVYFVFIKDNFKTDFYSDK